MNKTIEFQEDILYYKENLEVLKDLAKENRKKYKHDIFKEAQLSIEQILGKFALLELSMISNTSTAADNISELSGPVCPKATITEESNDGFEQVTNKKKTSKKPTNINKTKTHNIEIKPGMYLDSIDKYPLIADKITNLSALNDKKFYFKDTNFFDKKGGLYEFVKGSDTYYICEDKCLYKFDMNENLVPGYHYGVKQLW